jgi:hypothetical protein
MFELREWTEIADKFHDTLVLGNGASIAVHGGFNYDFLKEAAEDEERFILDEDQDEYLDAEKIFRLLDTTDFELVLNLLWHTRQVNEAFSIADSRTEPAYKLVRDALIRSVRSVHCSRVQIENKLTSIYEFMGDFSTVLSLNYDLIVYWALLEGNRKPGYDFKDCFTADRSFDYDWADKHAAILEGQSNGTLVFYPHGNIALSKSSLEGERKIWANQNFLLDKIFKVWERDEIIPLFVSEGSSPQKQDRINDSLYLKSVYWDVMSRLEGTVTIYGWNLDENDQHLIDRLFSRPKTRVAVSVHVPTVGDLQEHCITVNNAILDASPDGHEPEVFFFDAESENCWVNT